jgi:hypothetical protein
MTEIEPKSIPKPIQPPTQSLPMALSQELKSPNYVVYHSYPSTAEVNKPGQLPPVLHTPSLRGVLSRGALRIDNITPT